MQLRGFLYRKVKQLAESRKRQERKIDKDMRISKATKKAVNKLKFFMRRGIRKTEHNVDLKLNQVLENLQTSNELNKSIIKQNQTLISLLKKKRKSAH